MPLLASASIFQGKKAIFYTTENRVEVEAPRELLQQLVVTCDGAHTIDEVIQKLGNEWDSESVKTLIESLRDQKVLVDAQLLSEEYWNFVKNPSHYPRHAADADTAIRLAKEARERQAINPSSLEYKAQKSNLSALLSQRQSSRLFTGNSVAFQKLINIFWSSYGVCETQKIESFHRTVASAGALYPLNIHVALFMQTDELEPAIYQLYLGGRGSVGFRLVSKNLSLFCRSFLVHPLILQKAHGVIVVSGSFRITGEKYGNRGMLYVSLEAGNVAQNIHLSAIENCVGTVEIGGFADNQISEAMSLQDDYHPLTTIAFGDKDDDANEEDLYPNLEVQWAIPTNNLYRPPFAIASARASEKRSWSHGRDDTTTLAYAKAISEAKEWASCGCIPDSLVEARFIDLESAVDPREIVKFHPAQYRTRGFPFVPFDEKAKYFWTEGDCENSGSKKYILSDLVYFPYFPKNGKYYAYANSSGVAAHPIKEKAIEISTLELVERDSFMIIYLAQIEVPTIIEASLPLSIQERIKELRKVGFEITIKDHSLDLAPVACVLAQSEEYECTTCASCSSFDLEDAVSHALMETEAFVLARFENGKTRPIKPYEVSVPLDHGQLYDQKQYFHKADLLINSRTETTFDNFGHDTARSWSELLDRFSAKQWQLITIPLRLSGEYGQSDDLHIFRSVVPEMVPMTFGYRQEPAGMKRIYAIARQYRGRNLTYGELTKFPHPYA